jgi:hypothetical protein
MQALLTKELERTLPRAKSGAKVALVKYFTPWTHWTWYAAEASAELEDGSEVALSDPRACEREDVIFWGLVYGLEKEFGYWRLSELESIRGPAGLRIERDLDFRPTPLEECKDPTRRL